MERIYMAYSPKLKKLTEAQKKKLSEHSKHHSKKHMASMRMAMMKGKTFSQAHSEAMKKVGNGGKK
tara:strand:+ start:1700 stop:1897 length:198 start_codon:yes stop_codon:yes gene_type:complete